MPTLDPNETPFSGARRALSRMREMLQVMETDLNQYEAEWRELSKRHNAEATAAGLDRLYRPPAAGEDDLPWDRMPTAGRARASREAARATEEATEARRSQIAQGGKSWRSGGG